MKRGQPEITRKASRGRRMMRRASRGRRIAREKVPFSLT